MKLFRASMYVLMLCLLVGFSGVAQAVPVTVTWSAMVNGSNASPSTMSSVSFYVSTSDTQTGTLIASNTGNPNAAASTNGSTVVDLAPGPLFVHVVAQTTYSVGGYGFIGSFSLTNGTSTVSLVSQPQTMEVSTLGFGQSYVTPTAYSYSYITPPNLAAGAQWLWTANNALQGPIYFSASVVLPEPPIWMFIPAMLVALLASLRLPTRGATF